MDSIKNELQSRKVEFEKLEKEQRNVIAFIQELRKSKADLEALSSNAAEARGGRKKGAALSIEQEIASQSRRLAEIVGQLEVTRSNIELLWR
ncbi:hypothetical protein LOZ39_004637 [Ophidiomyces ophidiicola]|nr:hypothetical protein LOZ64_005133 [Ophidiomyces ophidiicola]KAI1910850.1 hypothetical protein LOZ61_004192 [Ophidiomyces ophidiicola]KAI1923507.1 hypothetical protein LOZ60_005175 [Ophidiomyces ophidiicola]KAI1959175.1 hypothetical protein LOZ59_003225 [Ophidiomyces ophidiicola]KAI2009879.1 hypothetical protein LOZ49_003685 [Ophidiomyces ophidiicola]